MQGGSSEMAYTDLCIITRSLYPKLDELHLYCALEKPDIVCISETWLCEDITLLECSIQGYHCVRHDRHRRGGGVAMYISDSLESQVILSGDNGLELLLVSVHYTNKPTHKVCVGVWYRPPHDHEAVDNLYFLLESLDIRILSNFIIIGDFNIDFLHPEHRIFSYLPRT